MVCSKKLQCLVLLVISFGSASTVPVENYLRKLGGNNSDQEYENHTTVQSTVELYISVSMHKTRENDFTTKISQASPEVTKRSPRIKRLLHVRRARAYPESAAQTRQQDAPSPDRYYPPYLSQDDSRYGPPTPRPDRIPYQPPYGSSEDARLQQAPRDQGSFPWNSGYPSQGGYNPPDSGSRQDQSPDDYYVPANRYPPRNDSSAGNFPWRQDARYPPNRNPLSNDSTSYRPTTRPDSFYPPYGNPDSGYPRPTPRQDNYNSGDRSGGDSNQRYPPQPTTDRYSQYDRNPNRDPPGYPPRPPSGQDSYYNRPTSVPWQTDSPLDYGSRITPQDPYNPPNRFPWQPDYSAGYATSTTQMPTSSTLRYPPWSTPYPPNRSPFPGDDSPRTTPRQDRYYPTRFPTPSTPGYGNWNPPNRFPGSTSTPGYNWNQTNPPNWLPGRTTPNPGSRPWTNNWNENLPPNWFPERTTSASGGDRPWNSTPRNWTPHPGVGPWIDHYDPNNPYNRNRTTTTPGYSPWNLTPTRWPSSQRTTPRPYGYIPPELRPNSPVPFPPDWQPPVIPGPLPPAGATDQTPPLRESVIKIIPPPPRSFIEGISRSAKSNGNLRVELMFGLSLLLML